MTVATILSAAPIGFDGTIIEVESDATRGLPSIQIVGLANKSVDEAKERVKSALLNSLLEYPARRLTINLAPAEIPKDGTHYDLPIALAILLASGQLQVNNIGNAVFAGELALTGEVRPIRGVISIAEAARKHGAETLYIPAKNAEQASLVTGITIIGVTTLKELFLHLKGEVLITPATQEESQKSKEVILSGPTLDLVIGQEQAKRALIIAVAGRHNILFKGPPGTGKTMLARTLHQLLPHPSPEEQLAITKMQSLAGEATDTVATRRPFRSPHHTASRTALIGGGTRATPGEISLAHHGVLFLDELPEYPRSTLEALRQPLEDRHVTISRTQYKAIYPADFMLVATMNPCPCGFLGDANKECTCSAVQIQAYQKRLSGPLLDRIDITITVPRVPQDALLHTKEMSNLQHTAAQKSIQSSLSIQHNRYRSREKYNSSIDNDELRRLIPLPSATSQLLSKASEKLQLSTRAYFKTIRLARTIADIEGAADIAPSHIAEALQYRPM